MASTSTQQSTNALPAGADIAGGRLGPETLTGDEEDFAFDGDGGFNTDRRQEGERRRSYLKGVNRRRAAVVAADWLAIGIGLAVSNRWAGAEAWSRELALAFGALVWLWMLSLNLYNSRLVTARSAEFARIANAGVRAMLMIGALSIFGAFADDNLGLRASTIAMVCTIAALCIEREITRLWFGRRRKRGLGTWASVLVADEPNGTPLAASINDTHSSPHVVVGQINPTLSQGDDLIRETLRVVEEQNAQGVILLESSVDAATANALVRELLRAGNYVDLISNLTDISADRLTTRSLGSALATWIAPRPLAGWRGRTKRLFDVTVASTLLVSTSWLFLILAAAVKLTSPGPVFFRQERVGRGGHNFKMLKFRSMVVDAEERLAELEKANEGAGPLFKMKNDPRVTRLGRIMRKTSLDELPQLLNVLANEMSLVGPRPALRSEMAEWDEQLHQRLGVKPGITGMWQVSGRSGTSFEEYTRLDLYYVHNWSLLVDVSIMLKTIPAVFRSEGAY